MAYSVLSIDKIAHGLHIISSANYSYTTPLALIQGSYIGIQISKSDVTTGMALHLL